MGIVVKIAKMLNIGKTQRGKDLFGGGFSKGKFHRKAVYYLKRHRRGRLCLDDDSEWTY